MANENYLTTVFAPDWRSGNSHQHHLGESLKNLGVQVDYLSHYRRVFPLLRGMKAFPEKSILYLHWPEAYMGTPGQRLYTFRQARFAYDLTFACRSRPLAVTAHNIYPHNFPRTDLFTQNLKAMYDRADGVIAHSTAAVEELSAEFQVSSEQIRVIRHGEVPELIHNLPTRKDAASQLGWSLERPVCLMFGAVSPYKGIEEVFKYWNQNQPSFQLVIVGRHDSDEYGESLKSIAGANQSITLRLDFVACEELQQWLSVADCCL